MKGKLNTKSGPVGSGEAPRVQRKSSHPGKTESLEEDQKRNVPYHAAKLWKLPPRMFLDECFIYNQETGILTWRVRPISHFLDRWRFLVWNKKWSGKTAGNAFVSKDKIHHVQIGITYMGKFTLWKAHHIILKMMGIEDSDGLSCDHKNRNPQDNRWENLRLTTHQKNCFNRDSPRVKWGSDMPKGVHIEDGKIFACIGKNGKSIHIGYFHTIKEAKEAYDKEAIRIHGEYARL